jgi:hydroxymethylbilane synthase
MPPTWSADQVPPLRIGSRGSKLALWQANFIQAGLERRGARAEIVIIRTSGDRLAQAPVGQTGLKGVFIKELEDALLEERIDLAVHSMKDVPTEIPPGLRIAAVCERADVRDALVSRDARTFAELPEGARVGTSSLRRRSQLLRLRPGIEICELRGNVDTRLSKLDRGEMDAIVVARAGLERLGLAARITETFAPLDMLPAAGQGALALECRLADRDTGSLVEALDHAETRAAVAAERALLERLEGGCRVPIGAWGRVENGALLLDAGVLSPDGAEVFRDRAQGSPAQPEAVGAGLAAKLLAAGAGKILEALGRRPDAGA